MRSFLIRDILSGAGGGGVGNTVGPAQGPSNQTTTASSTLEQQQAATQARFLAKWAEHQQQLQANKYLEQLQQQIRQLNPLNNHLNLSNHLQLQLQLQSQNQQHPNLLDHHHHHQQQQQQQREPNEVGVDRDDHDDDERVKGHLRDDDDGDNEDEEDPDDDDCADDEDEEIEIDVDIDNNNRAQQTTAETLAQQHHHHQSLLAANGKQLPSSDSFQLNHSPLDALFQMTSSTFDALKRGEKRKDRETADGHHGSSANFTGKQTSKKKRKSRTAFTNNQIYELERRFRIQKYLSPTDRDEIAMTLNLSNAQVITWFQNRRAKMKRDLEEQKRDIETASLLNLHKTFLESFQALSQMKTATSCNLTKEE